MIAFFPVTDTKIVLQAYFKALANADRHDEDAKKFLIETYKKFTPKVTQLLTAISSNDYTFYDSIAMIELETFVQEQVVLLGDAGYCPTFLSGMGASLSLLGAKVLSESLQLLPDIRDALKRYDSIVHPIAMHFHKNARSNMSRELPQNPTQAAILNVVMHYLPFSVIAKGVTRQLNIERKLLAN
jgi:2-polyprenyl-6-methoxyphenol hydroxylase-like FAD-dependent oxidoreductase